MPHWLHLAIGLGDSEATASRKSWCQINLSLSSELVLVLVGWSADWDA